jgi:hypothetical protein
MAEATNSVHLAKLRARLHFATRPQGNEGQPRAQGLKFTHFSRRDIVVRADAYLAEHREELIAEAKQIVERWERQGFFGRRAALNTGAQRRKA